MVDEAARQRCWWWGQVVEMEKGCVCVAVQPLRWLPPQPPARLSVCRLVAGQHRAMWCARV